MCSPVSEGCRLCGHVSSLLLQGTMTKCSCWNRAFRLFAFCWHALTWLSDLGLLALQVHQ